MATKREKMLPCRGVNSKVLNCIGTKKEADFYDSWSIWDGEKVPFCKDCLNKMYDIYLKNSNSEKVALYYTCMQINTPFIKEVYDTLNNKHDKNGKKITVTLYRYLTELQKKTTKKDTWKDFSSTNVSIDDSEEKVSLADSKNKKLEKDWGFQDEDFDYEFLEDTFNRYTDGVDFINQQQIDLYRDLCRDRLLLRKINDGRYNGEETIDKVQSRISKTMSILKVDQFEKKKEKTNIERILEKQIWEIENTEPAEVVDKEAYKDFLNIESDWGKHILRAIKNIITGSKDYPNIKRDD